jgi:hypothetical protein
VAERVIHGLEVIEVEDQQSPSVALAAYVSQMRVEDRFEAASIEQTGEFVVISETAQLALEPEPIGDIEDLGEQLSRASATVAQHGGVYGDPDHLAVAPDITLLSIVFRKLPLAEQIEGLPIDGRYSGWVMSSTERVASASSEYPVRLRFATSKLLRTITVRCSPPR